MNPPSILSSRATRAGRSRGQTFVLDLLMGTSVLVVISLFFTGYLSSSAQADAHAMDREEKLADAQTAIDLLVFSQGHPANWTAATVSRPGLQLAPGALSSDKLAALPAVDYDAGRVALGLSNYDANLTILNASTNTQLRQWPAVGAYTRNETTQTPFVIERTATVNGSVVRVRLRIW